MSTKTDLEDYWTKPPKGPEVPTEASLKVEVIPDVGPLDEQFGIERPKSVPNVLQEPLFGQPEPTEHDLEKADGASVKVPFVQTFAILLTKRSHVKRLVGICEEMGDSFLSSRDRSQTH